MPVSKRNKQTSLTKTKKQNSGESRSAYIDGIRSAVESRASVFIVEAASSSSSSAMGDDDEEGPPLGRTTQFKEVRKALRELKSTTLFMGKCKLMAIALGKTEEDELKPGLHLLSAAIRAGAALIVTDEPLATVQRALEGCRAPEFANAGFTPTSSLVLEQGPLPNSEKLAQVSMQPTLKKIGLAVEVLNSQLILINEFLVMRAGEPLTPEQAKMLTHLEMKLDEFNPKVVGSYVDEVFTAI